MKLRNLEMRDATFMLEWMHDKTVVENLRTDFSLKTIEDCKLFIHESYENKDNLNLAIVDEQDEYMGTVSLKNIDRKNQYAEFAITIRRCAMGKGYSGFGMKEIIKIAHDKYNLENVFWCVSSLNKRAVRFYRKNGYQEVALIPERLKNEYANQNNLLWYKA